MSCDYVRPLYAQLMAEELEARINAAHHKGLEETTEGCSGPQEPTELGQDENVPEQGETFDKELSTPQPSECYSNSFSVATGTSKRLWVAGRQTAIL